MSPRPYDIVTFDCYGTLIDWIGGITAAIQELARRRGHPVAPAAIFPAYLRIEPEVESATYRSYRSVLAETGARVTAALGWTSSPEEAAGIADSVPTWLPFPDTNPALSRLRAAGYRLGILSNVDDDLLEGTRRHFPVEFDVVVTAQQVRAYKPAHAHFHAARRRIEAAGLAGRWIHAAQSHYHDVVPAADLGIPVVWVNRHGEPLPAAGQLPLREVPSMTALADWLAGPVWQ